MSRLPSIPGRNNRILVFGDLHFPYGHVDTLDFLERIKMSYQPTRVIHLGDEIDSHNLSFHATDEDLPYSGSSELEAAKRHMRGLYDLFPVCDVLHSNHGSLAIRRAKVDGIPMQYIRENNEVLDAPSGWEWHHQLVLELPSGRDCMFAHQASANILQSSKEKEVSLVQGHHHSKQELHFWGDERNPNFAATPGCLIDNQSLAYAYNKLHPKAPRLGAMMIVNGDPVIIPMRLDDEMRWVGRAK